MKLSAKLLMKLPPSSRGRLIKLASIWGVKGIDAQLAEIAKTAFATLANVKAVRHRTTRCGETDRRVPARERRGGRANCWKRSRRRHRPRWRADSWKRSAPRKRRAWVSPSWASSRTCRPRPGRPPCAWSWPGPTPPRHSSTPSRRARSASTCSRSTSAPPSHRTRTRKSPTAPGNSSPWEADSPARTARR